EGQVEDWLPPALVPDALAGAAAERMLFMLVISEDLPQPGKRIQVSADGRISLNYTFGNLEGHDRLVQTLKTSLDGFVDHAHPIGAHHFQIDSLLPLYGTAHQCGTTRFGADPKTSVLDRDCKAHDLDNLYVVDTSFFVSANAINPTLTTVANALRVGDHLIDRLGASVPSAATAPPTHPSTGSKAADALA